MAAFSRAIALHAAAELGALELETLDTQLRQRPDAHKLLPLLPEYKRFLSLKVATGDWGDGRGNAAGATCAPPRWSGGGTVRPAHSGDHGLWPGPPGLWFPSPGKNTPFGLLTMIYPPGE